ncbi:MAG TPA: class I SAM-dependent methyltransferase [Actinomycetota bacterium]|nr:class I SAM-dependent methyltransferase [Actinomycetota bacterium]
MTVSDPVSAERGRRWFAAFYERRGSRGESEYNRMVRRRVAGEATGRILEIGAGPGFNFPYYADGASVVATEPNPEMLRRAEPRAREHGVELRAAPAERLPFPDGSFDTVVSIGVFCSVDDPERALTEVFRVLRPGGELRFSEHVRGASAARTTMQRSLDWLHYRAFHCHIGRDTIGAMRRAGFDVDFDRMQHADVIGVARKPGPPA